MSATEQSSLTLLSVVIPARNEEGGIETTIKHLYSELTRHHIPHEIVVVDDGSKDGTYEKLWNLRDTVPSLRTLRNEGENGYGRAVITGLNQMTGDAAVTMMADGSDDGADVVRYWDELNKGYDCVFGSRFITGGRVIDYPVPKLILNRLANMAIRIIFNIPLNDVTNAFKAYRKSALDGCRPFISPHFNLTVELPLKAIVRGYTWTVIPISWRNRTTGLAKFKIKEMGSRYIFICAYIWLEKYFSRGDYRKKTHGIPVV